MKNIVITILAVLVLGLGGNTNEIENNNENINNTVDNKENNNFISKYVGTYVGEKGTDSLTIKEDGTYEFILTGTSDGFTENHYSNGLVVSNGVYIALVEFYDTYPTEIAPLLDSYHFYINEKDSKLELFDENGTTDSIYFIKK